MQTGYLEDRIRRRAYEIYESRGAAPGNELDDWLQAEREVIDGDVASVTLSLLDDWDLVLFARVNVFLVGPDAITRSIVNTLRPYLSAPVIDTRADGPLLLTNGRAGTIILPDVDTLRIAEQHRVLRWLEHASERTQVISTASAPVRPLVDAGRFDERLYYRLNTVYIELAPQSRAQLRAAASIS